jgi:hypothetical protein
VDSGVASCLACRIRDLLLIKHANAENHDAEQDHYKKREHQRKFDERLAARGRLSSHIVCAHQ